VNKGTWLGSLATLVAVTVAGLPAAAQPPKKPNIVVILMDNLGRSTTAPKALSFCAH
jgi:arylsulfatase